MSQISITDLAVPRVVGERLASLLTEAKIDHAALARLVRSDPSLAAICMQRLNTISPESVNPVVSIETSLKAVDDSAIRQLWLGVKIAEQEASSVKGLLDYVSVRARALTAAQLALLWAIKKQQQSLDQIYLATLISYCQEQHWVLKQQSTSEDFLTIALNDTFRLWQMPVWTVHLHEGSLNEGQRCVWYAMKALQDEGMTQGRLLTTAMWLGVDTKSLQKEFKRTVDRVTRADEVGAMMRRSFYQASSLNQKTKKVKPPVIPVFTFRPSCESVEKKPQSSAQSDPQFKSVNRENDKQEQSNHTHGSSLLRDQLADLKGLIQSKKLKRSDIPFWLQKLVLSVTQLQRSAFFRYDHAQKALVLESQIQYALAQPLAVRVLAMSEFPMLRIMGRQPQVLWTHSDNRQSLEHHIPKTMFKQGIPKQLVMMAIHDHKGFVGVLLADSDQEYIKESTVALKWMRELQPLIKQIYQLCDGDFSKKINQGERPAA